MEIELVHNLCPENHFVLKLQPRELRLDGLKAKIELRMGSKPEFTQLFLLRGAEKVPLTADAQVARLESGARLFCEDADPNSALRGLSDAAADGARVELSRAEYMKREGTAYQFLRKIGAYERRDAAAAERAAQSSAPTNGAAAFGEAPHCDAAELERVFHTSRVDLLNAQQPRVELRATQERGTLRFVGEFSAETQRAQHVRDSPLCCVELDSGRGSFDGVDPRGACAVGRVGERAFVLARVCELALAPEERELEL